MNPEKELIFLDTKIYIDNGTLEFIKFRKKGLSTVISNFKHSVMSMKYLKGNIFTALHRERNACSTHEIFLKSLEELKEVFIRNSYPLALIEHRIKIFLSDDKKRERAPTNLTVVLDYTSPHIEQYICRLTRRMSNILPNFRVNISYRTIKVTKIFSGHAKAKIDQNVMCNLIYKFQCPCREFYIGQTKRCLQIRISEHQRKSSGSHVFSHIDSCPHYIEQADEYAINNTKNFTSPNKAKFAFFKSRFSVIKKGFRTHSARKNCEAYHIRVKRPKINDQKQLRAFTLF